MVRVNNIRLNDLIANFEECLEDIDYSINKLGLATEYMDIRMVKNSIRNGITSIFTNCEDYLGMVLKKNGVGVSDKSLRECLEYAKYSNLMESDFADCIINSIKMRNSFSHRYKVPSIEVLIDFYIANREIFIKQVNFMKELVSVNKTDSSSIF